MFDGALSVEFCPTCRQDQLVEVPPCSEGHADCCAERACTVCGTALLSGSMFEIVTLRGPVPPGAARRPGTPRERKHRASDLGR